ncbi:unnamed protein product [Citrullus colocynthis]|uniref:Uncharacterized protein n=1 Tax=Citrullus colocynthis TaxID=252529 RepID=A0ABP0XKU4_9ROSI
MHRFESEASKADCLGMPGFEVSPYQDAMLDFRQGPGCNNLKIRDFDPCLLTIKNANTLALCRWNYEALIWPSLTSLQGNFMFYNLKELWWIDYNSNEGYNSNALVTFLQMCPALERVFVTVRFFRFSFTFLMKQSAAKTIDKTNSKSFLNCSYIDVKVSTPYRLILKAMAHRARTYAKNVWRRAKLEHLKLVSLKGFMDQNEEMSLIRLIKELVSVNSLFMSVIDQNSLESLVEIPSNQFKSESFISIKAEKHGSNGRNSFFKLDDAEQTWPRHPHMNL